LRPLPNSRFPHPKEGFALLFLPEYLSKTIG
jgi:hypothetical protein